MSWVVVLTAAATVAACSGTTPESRTAPPSGLSGPARDAYLNEDAPALQNALQGGLQGPGFRRALELSRLMQDSCQSRGLEQLIDATPTWVAFVEHGDCAAHNGHERGALEDFVHAVDLAAVSSEIDYVVRRVCRAADETGLVTLREMCVGHLN